MSVKKRYGWILLALVSWLYLLPLGAKDTGDDAKVDQIKFDYFFLESLRQKKSGDFAAAGDNLYRCHLLNPQSAVVFFELADIASLQKQYSSAKTYAQRAIRLNPTNSRYHSAYAQLCVYTQDYEEAINEYRTLIKMDPQHTAEYYRNMASVYTMMNDSKSACSAWDGYAKETGLTQEIVEEKFKLYLKANDAKGAFKQIDQLIERYPSETSYIGYKAELYYALNDTVSANKTFEKALKKMPDDIELNLLYAKFLLEIEKREKSITYFKKVYDSEEATFDDKSDVIITLTGDSMVHLPDSIYRTFIAEYPNESLPLLSYGMALMDRKDSACYDYFQKSLELNPDQEEVWKSMITYYSDRSDLDSTIIMCEKACKNFPENSDLWYSLGYAYHSQQKDSLAIVYMQKSIDAALAVDNRSAASFVSATMGDIYSQNKDTAKAFAAYEKSLFYDPMNIPVMNNYAYYLSLYKKNLKKAEMMSLKTVQSDPNSPVYLDTYAWICFQLGEYPMARLYIEQAYNHGGNEDAELLEHYGDILFKAGESKDQYVEMWKKALEKREQGKETYDGLEKLRKKVKEESYVE